MTNKMDQNDQLLLTDAVIIRKDYIPRRLGAVIINIFFRSFQAKKTAQYNMVVFSLPVLFCEEYIYIHEHIFIGDHKSSKSVDNLMVVVFASC